MAQPLGLGEGPVSALLIGVGEHGIWPFALDGETLHEPSYIAEKLKLLGGDAIAFAYLLTGIHCALRGETLADCCGGMGYAVICAQAGWHAAWRDPDLAPAAVNEARELVRSQSGASNGE